MPNFGELELINQTDNIINDQKPIRVYRTKELDSQGNFQYYRWHLGWPEEVVKPLHILLETSPYWDEQHWKELDGFWLWWEPVITNSKEIPYKKLNGMLEYKLRSANKCLQFMKNATRKKEKNE